MNIQTLPLDSSSHESRSSSLVETLLFTAAGVATLFVLGKCINTAGNAAGLQSACWQLTGARAAAAAIVVGSMARFRVGQLALFGLLYGATMLTSHTNWTLVGSAALAGVAAWLVFTLYTARRAPSIVGTLLPALAYTLTITTSGLITAITAPTDRVNLANWSSGVGIRAASTVIAVACLWFATQKLNRKSAV